MQCCSQPLSTYWYWMLSQRRNAGNWRAFRLLGYSLLFQKINEMVQIEHTKGRWMRQREDVVEKVKCVRKYLITIQNDCRFYLALIHHLRGWRASGADVHRRSSAGFWICGKPESRLRLVLTCICALKDYKGLRPLPSQSETLWTQSGPLPEAEGFPDASEAHRDRGRGPSTDPWERGNRALAWIFQNKPTVDRSGFNSM